MSTFTKAIKHSAKFQSAIGFSIVVLGAMAMFSPLHTGVMFSNLLAICIGGGSLAIALYACTAPSTRQKVFQFLLGVIGIFAAYFIFRSPMSAVFTLSVTVIGYLVIDGLFMLYAAYQLRGEEGTGWMIISGILSLVMSALLIADWPLSGLYAIGMFVGIKLVVSGWTLAMLGFAEHAASQEFEEVEPEFQGSYQY